MGLCMHADLDTPTVSYCQRRITHLIAKQQQTPDSNVKQVPLIVRSLVTTCAVGHRRCVLCYLRFQNLAAWFSRISTPTNASEINSMFGITPVECRHQEKRWIRCQSDRQQLHSADCSDTNLQTDLQTTLPHVHPPLLCLTGYRKACLEHHPDKAMVGIVDVAERERIVEHFKLIQEAYETLSDPSKRREFDSVDEFDDSLPSECAPADFFKVCVHVCVCVLR